MTAAVAVRRATLGDFETLSALFFEYFTAIGLRPELRDDAPALRAFLTPPRAVWLAVAGDAPAGAIALRPLEIDGACEIKRLWVRPEFRGRGIAHALLDALEAFAAAEGYRVAYLDTMAHLTDAIALYRKRGYADCERYNDNPVAAVFMRRTLAPEPPFR